MRSRDCNGSVVLAAAGLLLLLPLVLTQVPLPTPSSPHLLGGSTLGVPLPSHTTAREVTTFSSPSVGVPLSNAGGAGSSTVFKTGTTRGDTTVGVPLPPVYSGGGKFATLGVSGPVFTPSVGRGIQDTKPQGNFASGFRRNALHSSIELDKSLSPVPPYFVFADDDSTEGGGTLTIGGPKTGALLPIASPTEDPRLLHLLSTPAVRQRLVAEARADNALKIIEILSAHRQMVGGQITYASLRAGETTCAAHRVNSLRGCHIDTSGDSYICEVAFWERPWLNVTRILDEKTGCAETETDVDFDATLPRSVGSLRGVVEGEEVGGVWAASPTLPSSLNSQQLAVEAFSYVDQHSDSRFRGYLASHSVHSVLVDQARNLSKVAVWVEYGFTTCLKLDWTKGGQKDPRTCPPDTTRPRYSCALTLLYHPSQLMPLRVVHGDDKNELTCTKQPLHGSGASPSPTNSAASSFSSGVSLAKDVGASCPGCPVQAAMSDPVIQSMMNFAVQEWDIMQDSDDDLHRPVALLSAYTQVTAGTKYLLSVEVAETVCPRGSVRPLADCPLDHAEETEICLFEVLHQPWLPSSHLLSARCFDKDEADKKQLALLSAFTSTATGAFSVDAVGEPLPSATPLKPVLLSLGGSSASSRISPPPEAAPLAQIVLDHLNSDLGGGDDSKGLGESKEFDSPEWDDADDGYYQLVKVHQLIPMGADQQRLVVELGETNCSRSLVPRTAAYCTLDPFEEHEVCDAVFSMNPAKLQALSCEDLGDYLQVSSSMPRVPLVTWLPAPFLPVGRLAAAAGLHTNTGYTGAGKYAGMTSVSTTDVMVRKAGELVVARYNLLSGEDELAILGGVLSAHTLGSPQLYLLEVEITETECKKYLPIIDQSKCPVDPTDDKIVCQAEVQRTETQPEHPSQQQMAWDGLSVNKLYCREREGYIEARTTGTDGHWTPLPANSPKMQHLAAFTADQYDLRSDDDDLFVLHKIVSARYQNVSGIRYDVVVELAETICPKYKEHINKSRCRIDHEEDIKLCNALLFEPPSGAGLQVTSLRCLDKPNSQHPNGGQALVLPEVHPSAHARPIFLNKFRKINFKALRDQSLESVESNEFIGGALNRSPSLSVTPALSGHRNGNVATALGRARQSRESAESNEQFYRDPRTPGSAPVTTVRRDDSRSNERDDSDEFLPLSLRRARTKRNVEHHLLGHRLVGGIEGHWGPGRH